jgi:hypothetical protein
MSEKRLFTDEELRGMGERTLDTLQAAIESGDREAAGKLAERMYAEFYAMHDLYRDWLTHAFSIIGSRYGDEMLAEVLQETVKGYTSRLADRYEGKSLKRKIQLMAAGLRGHLQPLEIEEDDEKVVIKTMPCGSGGRQALEALYEGQDAFHKMKGPAPYTFGRDEFPAYCAHCYYQNMFPLFFGEDADVETVPAATLGEEPCLFCVYKK